MLGALAAGKVLDSSADPTGQIQLRGDSCARLAHLLAVGAPACAGNGARDADGRTEQACELFYGGETFGASDAAASPDDDSGFAERDPGAKSRPFPDPHG